MTTLRSLLPKIPSLLQIGFANALAIGSNQANLVDAEGDDISNVAKLVKLNLNLMSTHGLVERLNDDFKFDIQLKKKDLTIKAGASVVIGQAGTGKTLFTTSMWHANPDLISYLSFREPEDQSIIDEAILYEQILDVSTPIVIVDSLRAFFFASSGGATGKGGVNMSLFTILTAWDVLGRAIGKHFMFVVNPLSADEDAVAAYVEAAKGAVSMVISTPRPLTINVTGRYMGDRGTVEFQYDAKPRARVVDIADSTTVGESVTPSLLASLYKA